LCADVAEVAVLFEVLHDQVLQFVELFHLNYNYYL
jgi:hypothetical protein